MYEVLVNDVRRPFSGSWYSVVGFKTYAQAKNFMRKEICSDSCFVYIRKLIKNKPNFVPRWRSINVFSMEYYRLTIQSPYISNLLEDRFKICLRRTFNATK